MAQLALLFDVLRWNSQSHNYFPELLRSVSNEYTCLWWINKKVQSIPNKVSQFFSG